MAAAAAEAVAAAAAAAEEVTVAAGSMFLAERVTSCMCVMFARLLVFNFDVRQMVV